MRAYLAASSAYLTGLLVFVFLVDLLSGGQNALGFLSLMIAASFAAFVKADEACSSDDRFRYKEILKMPFLHLQEGWPIYAFLLMALIFGYEIYHSMTTP